MRIDLETALFVTRALAALLILQQQIELVSIRRSLDRGAFRSPLIREEWSLLPGLVRAALMPFASSRAFLVLVGLRMLAAFALTSPSPFVLVPITAFLFVTQLVVSARFRGSFNGGSDTMTVVVLTGLLISSFPSTTAETVGLGYIAAQSTLSYLIAGTIKLLRPSWRNGTALTAFAKVSHYGAPKIATDLLSRPSLARLASASLIVFECAFPIALFVPRMLAIWLAIGALFHLGTWLVFGLNRFVLAWLATYPALVFVSGLVPI